MNLPTFDFSDKVALVTGASRGIGRAIALELARGGARVAVHYHRQHEAAAETLALLSGGGHGIFSADIADSIAAAGLIEAVIAQMGGLHILVNNAAVYEAHPILEVSYAEWQRQWHTILNTNLIGVANLMYAAAQHMRLQGGGRIVNISSRGAFRGEPASPAYGASKAGLNALSQSLAQALAPHHIVVGVVAPGWVETDMAADHLSGPHGAAIRAQSPFNRVAYPAEVARVAAFLAADEVEFLAGCVVDVNGASYLRT